MSFWKRQLPTVSRTLSGPKKWSWLWNNAAVDCDFLLEDVWCKTLTGLDCISGLSRFFHTKYSEEIFLRTSHLATRLMCRLWRQRHRNLRLRPLQLHQWRTGNCSDSYKILVDLRGEKCAKSIHWHWPSVPRARTVGPVDPVVGTASPTRLWWVGLCEDDMRAAKEKKDGRQNNDCTGGHTAKETSLEKLWMKFGTRLIRRWHTFLTAQVLPSKVPTSVSARPSYSSVFLVQIWVEDVEVFLGNLVTAQHWWKHWLTNCCQYLPVFFIESMLAGCNVGVVCHEFCAPFSQRLPTIQCYFIQGMVCYL